METIVLFDEFEVPKIKGLEYLVNDSLVSSDYMFINELKDGFSMYFEKNFPIFNIHKNSSRDYITSISHQKFRSRHILTINASNLS